MVEAKNLEIGKQYWFVPSGKTSIEALTFMSKVEGRKAYRFAQNRKKQVYILHERKLDMMFEDFVDATLALVGVLRRVATVREVAVLQPMQALNPPNLRDWTVAQGFPRAVKIGRT